MPREADMASVDAVSDVLDKTLRTVATLNGEPLPVFTVTKTVGDPVDNYYILFTKEGAEIIVHGIGGGYHVLVMEQGGKSRMYSDNDTPHARTIFWCAMTLVHRQRERRLAEAS